MKTRLTSDDLETLISIQKLIPLVLSYHQDIVQHIYHPDLSNDIEFTELLLQRSCDSLRLKCNKIGISFFWVKEGVILNLHNETLTKIKYFIDK